MSSAQSGSCNERTKPVASAAGLATRAPAAGNPLHDLVAVGKMPVMLELHLTEGDKLGYQHLRQRHLSQGYELPCLTVLGQYLRQLDAESSELTTHERPLVKKLQVYADLLSSGAIDMAALDDGSRGRDTLDNAIAAELLIGLGVDPRRLMANVVARNRQADQIRSRLLHFADLGLRNALLLTGDLPVDRNAPARFPLDSIGMLELARSMLIEGSLPDDFLPAAAGHPNPDADPDGLHTLHKALAGAKIIITQAIYSVEQFADWMRAIQSVGALDIVHVLAEVIPITSAAQLRLIADVPGMRVPRDLIEEMDAAQRRIDQAAQGGGHSPQWATARLRREGARITRQLLHRVRKVSGVSGFYLGCVKGFDAHLELLKEAPLLPEHAESLHKVSKIAGAERQRALADLPTVQSLIDAMVRDARRRRRRKTGFIQRVGNAGWVQLVFKLLEWPKAPLFNCKKCDRCDLSPDALVCPRGCAKEMSHGPCGAPRLVNGRMLCEDTSRECTWALINERRTQYGVPLADRLEVRPAPSRGFYEGKTYSAVLPVLTGEKSGPNWRLVWAAPVVRAARLLSPQFTLAAEGSPRDLRTLAAAKAENVAALLTNRPDADPEEVLVKVLALIGTPAAWYLIESRLAEVGLPAEGTFADLSLREQFQLAEALPAIRRRFAQPSPADQPKTKVRFPVARYEELLAIIPEGKRLRQALRAELAAGLIGHIASLGVSVTHTGAMLETRNVDDFLPALTILKDELQLARTRLPLEAGGLSVHFHRVHYKHHYHAPIAVRRTIGRHNPAGASAELRIDLRQYQDAVRFRTNLREALERLISGRDESDGAVRLEDYGLASRSLCWQFNAEFWKRLRQFERATGIHYDASIGGSSDHNLAYARSAARAFFDRVHDHHLHEQRLYVLEIGVAATHRAQSFLQEYRRLCDLAGTESHRNVTYLLADFSETILAAAAAELSRCHSSVEAVKIDAADPLAALRPYQGQVIHAHLCNVYDNLPADHVAWMDDRLHTVEARLYLAHASLTALAAKHGFTTADFAALQAKLTVMNDRGDHAVAELLDWCQARLIELGKDPLAYIHFWMDLFHALRFDERYVVVDDAEALLQDRIPGLRQPGDLLRRQLSTGPDLRVHLNLAAIAGFARLLTVLHPHGTLEVIDLFVQRLEEYHNAFKGPAKYDGSTVNWLNGPLFRAVAEQLGYTVRFQSFRPFDPKSSSVVLLAHPIARIGEDQGAAEPTALRE